MLPHTHKHTQEGSLKMLHDVLVKVSDYIKKHSDRWWITKFVMSRSINQDLEDYNEAMSRFVGDLLMQMQTMNAIQMSEMKKKEDMFSAERDKRDQGSCIARPLILSTL